MGSLSEGRSVTMWLDINREVSVHAQAVSVVHYAELNYQQALDVWN